MEKELEKKVCSRVDYVNRKIKWIKEDFDILTNSDRLPERVVGYFDKVVIYPSLFIGCYIACFFDRRYGGKD